VTRIVFAIPGDLHARTGGYGYDRRILSALPQTAHLPLPGAFPHPSAADVADARETIVKALRAGDVLLIDGLAYGALPTQVFSDISAKIVALCHHPLCLETGLSEQQARALFLCEQAALRRADRIIVTSSHTRDALTGAFAIPAEKIAVAPPGVDRAPRATGAGGAPQLLAVGSLIARKGYDLLIDALRDLTPLDWRLTIVGGAQHAPQTAAKLRAQLNACGLSSRILLYGEAGEAELASLYAASDVFVSSSHYEGYGMALAEAMTRGLAIVASTGGAAAQTLPDDAGIKVPPGDVAALRDGLKRVLEDAALRTALSDAAWRAAQGLPRWEDAAHVIAAVAEGRA
jgi:glycosyltransferase involved in cell wall biosynthesis